MVGRQTHVHAVPWATEGSIPLGRKSLPTMFSRHDDLPLDCEPMTVIWGRSMGFWTPTVANASWSLLTVLMSSGSMMPPTPGMPSISDMAVFKLCWQIEQAGGPDVRVDDGQLSRVNKARQERHRRN